MPAPSFSPTLTSVPSPNLNPTQFNVTVSTTSTGSLSVIQSLDATCTATTTNGVSSSQSARGAPVFEISPNPTQFNVPTTSLSVIQTLDATLAVAARTHRDDDDRSTYADPFAAFATIFFLLALGVVALFAVGVVLRCCWRALVAKYTAWVTRGNLNPNEPVPVPEQLSAPPRGGRL
ncbi:hypothetical protein C8R46DRAFT_1246625 [Mycena filopes]|nr:hypothetical protein C8R46DRAFT_1246625 [Mycena filopes]